MGREEHDTRNDREGECGHVKLHDVLIDEKRIEDFCKKWKISEFALFGSVLTDEFRPDSDIDVLVSFEPESGWGLWDLVDMKEELEAMFGRKVDVVQKAGLNNPFRRKHILDHRKVIYVV